MRIWKLLSLILIIVLLTSHAPTQAQENGADACPAIVSAALDVTAQACEDLSRNEACYGHIVLTATPRAGVETFTFVDSGDRVAVDRLERLRLGPMNALQQTWGVALMRIQANLPDTLPGQAVTMVLFGDVEVTNAVISVPRLNVTAVRGVNVRQQPSTSGQVLTSLVTGDEVEASGRTEDGWLRISLPDGRVGWVSADFVSSAGDLAGLAVIEDFDAEPTRFTPMQAFTLNTGFGSPGCAEAPGDGLLIQTPEDSTEAVALVINDTTVMLGSTIYIQAARDDHMLVRVVEGYATVTAAGETQIAPAGTQIRVPLDDLTVSGPPSEPAPYEPAAVAALPITVVEREITIADPVPVEAIPEAALAAQPCTVTAVSPTTQYRGPGLDYASVLARIPEGQTRSPQGYALDTAGFTWWHVTANLWVRGDTVEASASCAYLPVEESVVEPDEEPIEATPGSIIDLNSIASAPACIAAPFSVANLRTGPGTLYGLAGQLEAAQEVTPTAYSQGTDGYRWWRLADDTWIRSDLVASADACASLPEAAAPPPPAAPTAAPATGPRGRTYGYYINECTIPNNPGVTLRAGDVLAFTFGAGPWPTYEEAQAGPSTVVITVDGTPIAITGGGGIGTVEYGYARAIFTSGWVSTAGSHTVTGIAPSSVGPNGGGYVNTCTITVEP